MVVGGLCSGQTKLLVQNLERVISVAKVGPEIDLPRIAPAGSLIAAQLQRLLCRRCQRRRLLQRYLVSRKQCKQVRDVAMVHLRGVQIPVVPPLLQLACLSNLKRLKSLLRCLKPGAQRIIHAQNLAGRDGVGEYVPDDLALHGGAIDDGCDDPAIGTKLVLGRKRRRCD